MPYLAYSKGQWVPAPEVGIGLNDIGFLLGATVVERLRTFAGAPFRVADHLTRLENSLRIVGWNADAIVPEVQAAVEQFVPRNQGAIDDDDDWGIAALVTPGTTFDGSSPHIYVHGAPLAFNAWADQFDAGAKVEIVDVRQTPNNCWPAELKCRSRMHYYLADRQAAARVPGARALLLDQRGFVAEASTANVAAFFSDRGLVLPQAGNVLPGISQAVLSELAAELEIPLTEADMTPEEFCEADEGLLISTSICTVPIVAVDGRPLGGGQPGPIYRRLLAAWSDRVGLDIAGQAQRFRDRKLER